MYNHSFRMRYDRETRDQLQEISEKYGTGKSEILRIFIKTAHKKMRSQDAEPAATAPDASAL